MLPVLERLLYKPKTAPVTRVLVLTPTRELGVQVHGVSRQLAQFTRVDVALSVGKCKMPVNCNRNIHLAVLSKFCLEMVVSSNTLGASQVFCISGLSSLED